MGSHYTWGPVITLHGFGSVLGRRLDTSFGLAQSYGHGSLAHLWSGPKLLCLNVASKAYWHLVLRVRWLDARKFGKHVISYILGEVLDTCQRRWNSTEINIFAPTKIHGNLWSLHTVKRTFPLYFNTTWHEFMFPRPLQLLSNMQLKAHESSKHFWKQDGYHFKDALPAREETPGGGGGRCHTAARSPQDKLAKHEGSQYCCTSTW